MILLWGLPGDDPFDAVASALSRRRADFTLLDQREVLDQRIELDVSAPPGGELWSDSLHIVLDEVRALYTRVYEARKLSRVAAGGAAGCAHASQVEGALWAWADETPARVVNRASTMASNSSKPYQSLLIARAGFLVPDTLVTTDPEAAAEFWDRHGQVIYKSVSAVRSVVSRLGPGHRNRLANVVCCPTQFQAYVPGRDHRVHVVGDNVFAIEVVSDADDYRYARDQLATCELRVTKLPHDIAELAYATAKALDLPVCGLDLRRTPEGAWYCFEVNPSPCFTYYEYHTGQPIADAVAALLDSRQ